MWEQHTVSTAPPSRQDAPAAASPGAAVGPTPTEVGQTVAEPATRIEDAITLEAPGRFDGQPTGLGRPKLDDSLGALPRLSIEPERLSAPSAPSRVSQPAAAQVIAVRRIWTTIKGMGVAKLRSLVYSKNKAGWATLKAMMDRANLRPAARRRLGYWIMGLAQYRRPIPRRKQEDCLQTVARATEFVQYLQGKSFPHHEWSRGKWRLERRYPFHCFDAWIHRKNLSFRRRLRGKQLPLSELKLGRAFVWVFRQPGRQVIGAKGHTMYIAHIDRKKGYFVVVEGGRNARTIRRAYDIRHLLPGGSGSFRSQPVQTPWGPMKTQKWPGTSHRSRTKALFLVQHRQR
jgi:hypothetical protein